MPSVFLCHSSKDKSFVKELAGDLERRGITAWVDEAEIMPGQSLIEKISEAIKEVDYFAAILSNNSLRSKWVKHELEQALTVELDGKKDFIIPIVIENVDIPIFIKNKRYSDFRQEANRSKELQDLTKHLLGINKTNRTRNFFSDYSSFKKQVLSSYEKYKTLLGNSRNQSLEERINRIRQNKYTLTIVGEQNAGKSTFINALLGEMILPTDVMQNTSMIIEIHHSDNESIRIRYANGRTTHPRKGVKESLRKFASIQEDERLLPIPQLNDFLINRKGKYTKRSVEELLKRVKPKSQKEDEQNPRVDETFRQLVEQYLEKHKSLNIPVEINVGFPLQPKFREIRIVDTPGVNASGDTQRKTYECLNQYQSAIIFVHPITELEKESFEGFVTDINAKNKENLFFILTKSSRTTGKTHLNRNLDWFLKRFCKDKQIVPSEKVVWVDSLLKVIADDSAIYPTFEALRQYYKQQIKHFESLNPAEQSEFDLLIEKLNLVSSVQNKTELNDDLEGTPLPQLFLEMSNFSFVEAKLNDLASNLPFADMISILEAIKLDIQNHTDNYRERAKWIDQKKRSPERFIKHVKETETKMLELQRRLEEVSANIKKNFKSKQADWRKQIEVAKSKFLWKIEDSRKNRHFRRECDNFSNSLEAIINQLMSTIYRQVSRELRDANISIRLSKFSAHIPDIDIDRLIHKAEKKAIKKRTQYEEVTVFEKKSWLLGLWEEEVPSGTKQVPIGTLKKVDKKKFRKQLRAKIGEHLRIDILPDVYSSIEKGITNYNDSLFSYLTAHIEERKQFLKRLKEDRRKNESLLKEGIEIEQQIRQLEIEAKNIDLILQHP